MVRNAIAVLLHAVRIFPVLTPRQQRFVDEYLSSGNGTRAAIEAGYSERSARSIASELIRKPAIRDELERRQGEMRRRADLTAFLVARHLAAIAFASYGDLYRDDGSPKRGDELDSETRIAIRSLNRPRKVHSHTPLVGTPFRLYDKIRALNLLCQVSGFYPAMRGRRPRFRPSD